MVSGSPRSRHRRRRTATTRSGPTKTYMYRVRARDAAGNRSRNSRKLIATASNKVVIAAAGDIACDPSDPNFHNGTGTSTACRQLSTSNVLVSGDFDAVLALGDLQYNSGSLDDFRQACDPTWGRVKSMTYPVAATTNTANRTHPGTSGTSEAAPERPEKA